VGELILNKDLLNLGKEVISILKDKGYEAYFVGGCVRDLLLEMEITDIDLTTNAKPEEINKIFEQVIPIGIEHGTVLVRYKKESFEITTYRTEGTYSDKRHPDYVQFIMSIEEDLKRRDFTINAMAMDEKERLLDPFKGREDINRKIIRAVGNPKDRFLEDPLRIIRAIRFSSQLGFSIEQETLQQMIELKGDIASLAQERITEEIRRLFLHKYVAKGVRYILNTGIDNHLPIIKEYPYVLRDIVDRIKPIKEFSDLISLFHIKEKKIPISKWIKEWKCSKETRKNAEALVLAYEEYMQNGLHPVMIYKLPVHLFNNFIDIVYILQGTLISIEEIESFYKELPVKNARQLAVNGSDIIQLLPDKKPGRWVQQLLEEITRQVLLKKLSNDKEVIKEWAKCHLPKEN